jgi:hypothetical protein
MSHPFAVLWEQRRGRPWEAFIPPQALPSHLRERYPRGMLFGWLGDISKRDLERPETPLWFHRLSTP